MQMAPPKPQRVLRPQGSTWNHMGFHPYLCVCPDSTVLGVNHTGAKDPLASNAQGQM